jgi:cell division protein ZapA
MEQLPKNTIKVVIYNQTYTLRSDHDPAYIQELAEYVDSRMEEIAHGTMTVDSLRVAILAALQIADELHMNRKELENADKEVSERSTRYGELLDQCLRPAPTEHDKP